MYAKVFTPLLGHRVQPGQKFAQLKLLPKEHRRLTHHLQCLLPLSVFDSACVDFARRELDPGRVVEVRQANDRLIGLGFYEPQLQRVDVFDLIGRNVTSLPTVSEDFFVARVHAAWERRRRRLHQSQNNTYRIVNGHVDGLPSLYVDMFSDSFVRVIATSAGAERLVPAVAEFLRRSGTEEILLDTPTLGDQERLTLVSPTMPMSRVYVENGIRHMWLREKMRVPTVGNRYLINCANRRARRMLRDLGRGKRVLCVNDRSGSAAMNAVMTAKHVTVVDPDEDVLDWVRENLVANHSSSVFQNCETVRSSLDQLEVSRQQDVVYLEHHYETLATREQWGAALVSLIRKGVMGTGTIVVMSQEAAPLGIPDLLPRHPQSAPSVSRIKLAEALRDAAEECRLRVRFLRAFSPSVDYPLFPEETSVCFSQTYLIEGPLIE